MESKNNGRYTDSIVVPVQLSSDQYCRGDSDAISSYHIYASHDVGQTLRNVCHCDIVFVVI